MDYLSLMSFTQQPTSYYSCKDGILPVLGTVIFKVAHYKTGKVMPIRFFMVDTKNEIIISYAVNTQLRYCVRTKQNSAEIYMLSKKKKTPVILLLELFDVKDMECRVA